MNLRTFAAPLFILAMVVLAAYGSLRFRETVVALDEMRAESAAQSERLADNERTIAFLNASSTALAEALSETENALAQKTEENQTLSERLGIVTDEKTSLEHDVNSINDKVSILEKLSSTDKELLQKYSKVYFLNENYVPSSLATVTPDLVWDQKKTLYVLAGVEPYLENMMQDAASSSHPLLLISAYRSFADQSKLKNAYTVTYGSGANAFSADQGYSEHQLGTTVDFTSPVIGGDFTDFDKTGGYKWLLENAWKYGFILSYPKGNAYYIYEPWHWRYVGVVLAATLHQEGKNFYDLDQREIDKYLIDLF